MSEEAQEVAAGVHRLAVGRGAMRSNVYLVRSGESWALVDAGSGHYGSAIREAAESLFGAGTRPAAILLTHDHPDHIGSVRESAQCWGCPVWVHPDELPLTAGEASAVRLYANPLDRWVILPLFRLMGEKRSTAVMARSSLVDVVQALDGAGAVPGLPDWTVIHTPGHTPGHVAFFRHEDRVLLTGDAVVTINLNSILSLARKRPVLSGPPWYVTWDRGAAVRSIRSLADLEPWTVAGGHGIPMSGPETAGRLRALADRLWRGPSG